MVRAELLRENANILRRAIEVLSPVDEGLYSADEPRTGSAAVGQHVRHCVDFYECFLGGVAEGRVDYDARARSARLERERDHAVAKLGEIVGRLNALVEAPLPAVLLVRMDAAEGSEGWARSSPERELQFLASHTVHHLALVALQLKLTGTPVPSDLGVARATARYREAAPARAR